jgi:tRNA (Thr-GGU) A37 N-methylase
MRADESRGSWAVEIDAAYREGLCALEEFGRVHVIWWAHQNDTPQGRSVLDLKPYIPLSDRARELKVPEWFRAWPEWTEDAGAFFSSASALDVG